MIGVVVPAHNEAEYIGETLVALIEAAAHPRLGGEEVRIIVVMDDCRDGTASVVDRLSIEAISVTARNVGAARARGAEFLIARGARWLSFTDADTLVAPEWLVAQLDLKSDAVCGSIGVRDWGIHGARADSLRLQFSGTYTDTDGHRHIHGANLGVCAVAYRRAGGFKPLASGEDVDLVGALKSSGARIAWSAAPRVWTSARVDARARGGFGDAILAVMAIELQGHKDLESEARCSDLA